ncbi:phosphate ABC transporter permease PstA [Microcoleus sp. FACHB-68]|nr:phosphate ABC transporter permease PstA [Microcoleus sp. FACHB-68]MBD1937890.1 phosphate ABC transporter permease PstA [Microcoleus sp. FACHB-68]
MPANPNRTASGYPSNTLTRSPNSPRTLFGTLMTGLTFSAAAIALLPLVAVLSYVIIKGASRINLGVFTELPPVALQAGGGFGNAIQGTLIMVAFGALISIPVGVLAAVYVSEFAAGTQFASWIRFFTNVLSGVPSIIVGVFAYGVFVLTTKNYSAFAGGFALSVLMLPIIVRATEESLKLVPQETRQGALGLGATNFQTVARVVLPAALPAIVTGTTLAVARAAGETAPLLFTALFSQYYLPITQNGVEALNQPAASLAVLVYNFATRPYENQKELAWAAALILVLLVLLTSIISRFATARKVY